MISARDSITITCPVNEVFAYVADLRNDHAWHTDLLEVEQASTNPVGPGTTYRARIKPFMGNTEATMEIVTFVSERCLELRGVMGPLRPHISLTFDAQDSGTIVTRHVTLQPPGLMRLMQPVMSPMFRKRNVTFLGNLKRVLETGVDNVN